MESITDLLGRYKAQEPDEAKIIKQYIAEQFDEPATVLIQPKAVIITIRSAALANTLRLRTTELQKITKTDKRLVFRISQ